MHADLSIKRLLERLETLEAEVAALRREMRTTRRKQSMILITPTGWAMAITSPRGTMAEIRMERGRMAVRRIVLRGTHPARVRVTVAGRSVACRIETVDGGVRVVLNKAVTLKAGQVLKIVAARK